MNNIKYANAYYACRKMRRIINNIECKITDTELETNDNKNIDIKLLITKELEQLLTFVSTFTSNICGVL